MKTKEIIRRARKIAKPFRVTKGKNFRLKDVDPNDTLEFTEEDKPRSKEALVTYLVTQTGIAPSDPLLKTRMFVLRPDGYWVDFNAYASQGKPEAMDEIVFPSTVKVMETFGKLFGQPRGLDLWIDEAGLNAWIERHSSDPLQAVRGWVAQYTACHRKDTEG